jgi:hypothetical protein
MNSPARKIDHRQNTKPDPLVVFLARCEARADLVANNMMQLRDAVDGLQLAAERTGLVDELGQDGVQRLMATAFAPVWRL